MANIKTAISIEEQIFEQVNALAEDLHVSRSRVFALAVQEFFQRHENVKLLETLNKAYDDLPGAEDRVDVIAKMRPRHRTMVKDRW